jgi:dethiobiotin synthetase
VSPVFVTGTDTGVGKTVACAALVREAQNDDLSVAYFKPVQTGVGPGEPGDADFVRAVVPDAPATEGIRFAEPLAPAVAAERAGREIDVEALCAMVKALSAAEVVIVEGAGGLLVPLIADFTMADFAVRIADAVVVVTRPGLGTLNHTALTVEVVRARGLPLAGIVIAGWPAVPGVVELTNLERMGRMAPILGVVPHVDGLDTSVVDAPGAAAVELLPAPDRRA